ncbi:DNA-binding transcriptional MerR regulator [Allocatelliglobosispora scoriae]|uniref:DNA-binding transcriptional MerR regulator n=1 Tax=Allocatelliglobosispora scoriae TaxID=643052 RepID=A0A841BJU8_9ACTN|nr:MerR family transcriptional regulator [Allocatelliglobosispora scoriae]MBB5867171.1 DNA-binding transcriptional MerR regulator [Allocatelliglobosispora scoriae]
MSYSIGRVAEVAHVTVRTLHHYDEIGLLSPSGRTAAGYRRYSDGDLQRLQQILLYRELGFSLEEIAKILDDPDLDLQAHLRRQHELLSERADRIQSMIAAVEFALEASRVGIQLTPEERFEVFGDVDPDQYADEARERWGDTDAYQQSQRRVATYTKEDWQRIQGEAAKLLDDFAAAMRAGLAPDSPEAMALAEEHRRQISASYYDCSYEIQTGLAEMYLADERFTAHYEQHTVGMARYVHDAILANAIDKA